MLKAALVTVALSLLVARPAAAQSKSWAAVKGSVTPQAAFVFGINADPIRKTQTWSTVLKMFLDGEEDAKQAFDMIKSNCQIDVPSVVSDVTAIMKADEKPLVVLGLSGGLDEAKVVACLEKIGNSLAGNTGAPLKLTAKKKGKITEYSVPGEAKKIYVAWLAADVLAFTDDPNDKAKLTKMLTGKAAKGDLGKWLPKVSTAAPIWFAVAKKSRETAGTILGGYGQVDIVGADVKASGHMVWAKPAEAAAAAAEAQQGLTEAKAQMGTKMPIAKKVLDTVVIAVNGNVIDLSGSVADKDIVTLIPDLDKLF